MGGTPSIEYQKSKMRISGFFKDIDPIFKIVKHLLHQSQGFVGTRRFSFSDFWDDEVSKTYVL